MRINIRNIGPYFFLACSLLTVLAACSFPGDVYISFSWSTDRVKPDLTFISTVPNIPTDIDNIGNGDYFFTTYGTFTVSYNYTDDTVMRTLQITMESKVTVMGKENSYYDFIFHRDKPPEFYEVPQGF